MSQENLEIVQRAMAAYMRDDEDLVFVGTRESGRGKISGILMEHESIFVFTLSDDRIVRIQVFGSEREALHATGLAE